VCVFVSVCVYICEKECVLTFQREREERREREKEANRIEKTRGEKETIEREQSLCLCLFVCERE